MHIHGISEEEIGPLADVFERTLAATGFNSNSSLIMARRPETFRAYRALGETIMTPGDLGLGLVWLVAHVASTAAGCRYCQAHTATHSVHWAEVDPEKVERVWDFERDPLFDERERAALRLARDAAQVPNATTAEHFEELRRHFTEDEIIHLVLVISMFGFANRWNDTMATQLEAKPLEFARGHLAERGWEAGKHA